MVEVAMVEWILYEYTIDGGGTGAVEEGGPHII